MRESSQRRSGLVRGVIAVLVVLLAVGGVLAFFAVRDGEARSPSDVTQSFRKAGVVCSDYEVISDERDVKALGCRAKGAQIITITTYGNRPSPEEWLDQRCESVRGAPRALQTGFVVVGDDVILDLHQLPHPDFVKPTPLKRVAERLARVLAADATRYDCVKR